MELRLQGHARIALVIPFVPSDLAVVRECLALPGSGQYAAHREVIRDVEGVDGRPDTQCQK